MEKSEVSEHEVRVWRALAADGGWLTNKEIAVKAGVAGRTARLHSKRLAELQVLDVAEVFPGHRYRVSEFAAKRNASYIARLTMAAEVFGIAG